MINDSTQPNNIDLPVKPLDLPVKNSPAKLAYQQAMGLNPDQVAQTRLLAVKTGQPEPFIAAHLPEAQAATRYNPEFWDRLEKDYPGVAKWAAIPENMAVAHDDLEEMGQFEQTYNFFKNNLKAAGGSVGGMVEGLGGAINASGSLDKAVFGTGDYQKKIGGSIADYGRKMGQFYAVENPTIMNKLVAAATSGATFFIPGLGIARGAGVLAAFPRLAALTAAGASSAFESAIEAGMVHETLKGKGMSDGSALAAASKTFAENLVLNTALNKAGGLFDKALPGAKATLKGEGAVRAGVKSGARAFAAEGTQEGLQQVISNEATGEPLGAGVAESAVLGGIVGGGMSVSLDMDARFRTAKAAEGVKNIYLAMGESLAASKLRARLPEAQKAFVSEVIKDGPVKNIYLDREAAEVYFQDKGMDPDETFKQMGATEAAIEESKQADGRVEIPLSDWAANVVGTEHYSALADDVAFERTAPTARTAKAAQAEIDTAMDAIGEQVKSDEAVKTDFEKAVAVFKADQEKLGVRPTEAAAFADVMARRSIYLARAEGKTVDEVLADRPTATTPIDYKYGFDRDGKPLVELSPEEIRQITIENEIEVLAENGGVTPTLDAIRALGGIDWAHVKKAKMSLEFADLEHLGIFRKGGKTVGQMAQALGEKGIIGKELDEDELADLIDKESKEANKVRARYGEQIYKRVRSKLRQAAALKQASQKELVAVHNLTATNLKHADKMGGMAVPSMAIVKAEHGLDNFGEITLVAAKDLVDPSRASTKVFNSDIYSARYPSITYDLDSKEVARASKALTKEGEALGRTLLSDLESASFERKGMEAAFGSAVLQLAYLNSIGKGVEIPKKVPNRDHLNANPALEKVTDRYATVWELLQNSEFVAEYKKAAEAEGKKIYEAEKKSGATEEEAKDLSGYVERAWFKEGQPNPNIVERIRWEKVEQEDGGKPDFYEGERLIREAIEPVRADFEKWVEDNYSGLVSKEKLYKGRDRNGYRRYMPHTLENVVKLMKKELLDAEGFNYGLGSLRSNVAKRYRTLSQITADKEKLMNKATFEKAKALVNKEFEEILDEAREKWTIKDSSGFGSSDVFLDVIKTGIKRHDIKAELEKFNFPGMDVERIKAFLETLRHMPTEYFEAKLQRAVGLNEFAGAVIPQDSPAYAREILERNGIPYKEYSSEADRSKVLQDFVAELNNKRMDILFQDAFEENPEMDPAHGSSNLYTKTLGEFVKEAMDFQRDNAGAKKTDGEIIHALNNDMRPIGEVNRGYLWAVGAENPVVYTGLGYFVAHHVNHHPNVSEQDYHHIPEVLANPDEVRIDRREKGREKLVFFKRYDKENIFVAELDKAAGKIFLHRTFFAQNKKPYGSLPVVRFMEREGDISSISHTGEPAPGRSLSARLSTNSIADATQIFKGEDVAREAVEIGTNGGWTEFSLAKIRANNYRLVEVPLDKILAADPDVAAYVKAGELRKLEGEGNMDAAPIIDKTGEVLDGYNRILQHVKNGDIMVRVYLAEKADGRLFQSAWHGSPFHFDKFTLDHIGRGEGAQAYGWGLYFAGNKEVAEYYREKLAESSNEPPQRFYKGTKLTPGSPEYHAATLLSRTDRTRTLVSARKEVAGWIKEEQDKNDPRSAHLIRDWQKTLDLLNEAKYKKDFTEKPPAGKLYEVEIPEDDVLLDWDKPWSEQSELVKKFVVEYFKGKAKPHLTGKDIYFSVVMEQPSAAGGVQGVVPMKEASLFLNSYGIKGIKYLDGTSRDKGSGFYNYVIFDDGAIEILNKYYQADNSEAARGFYDVVNNLLVREKNADASTYWHEFSHYYLDRLFKASRSGKATASFMKDWAVIAKWLEVAGDQAELTREQHEQFARGSEAYLRGDDYLVEGKAGAYSVISGMTGKAARTFKTKTEAEKWIKKNTIKAPSKELRGSFAKFRRWLTEVYKSVKQLNVVLSEDVRAVFDRMLAAEGAVAEAEADLGLDKITEGLPEVDAAKLKAIYKEAHEEAVEQLTRHLLKGLSVEGKAQREKLRAELEKEVRANLRGVKTYRATEMMGANWREDAQAFGAGTLDAGRARELELIAETTGFSSADEMAKAVLTEKPFEEVVAEHINRVMAAHDELQPDLLKAKAQELVHVEKRIELMALEKQLIRGKIFGKEITDGMRERWRQEASVEAALAKRSAAEILGAKQVTEAIRFGTYATMERNAAAKVAAAMAAKDYVKAVVYKRHQMVCHALYTKSLEISRQFEKKMGRIDKILKKPMEQFKDQDSFDQVGMLLMRFNFGTLRRFMPIAQTPSLTEYIKHVNAIFSDPLDDKGGQADFLQIPEWIISSPNRNWKELSWGEFQDVFDSISAIIHAANKMDSFFTIDRKATLSAVADELAVAAHENNKDRKGPAPEDSRLDKARALWDDYLYRLDGIDALTQAFDGYKDGGIWQAIFMDPMREQAGKEDKRMREFRDKMKEIWAASYSEKEAQELFSKQKFYEELGASMSKSKLIAMLLNMGALENREKLFRNPPVGMNPQMVWNETTVTEFLGKNLTAKDCQFAQAVWDTINELWPDVVNLHSSLTGFEPLKVEAVPFSVNLPSGEAFQFAGGYFPLKADPRANNKAGERAAQREIADAPLYTEQNSAARAMTRTGHTKKRTTANYTLMLDLGLVDRHLRDVIHDLYFRGLVFDLRRLLANEQVMMAAKTTLGPAAYRALLLHVNSYATGAQSEKLATDPFSRAARWVGTRVSRVVIVGKVAVIAQNLANSCLAGTAVEWFGHWDAAKAILFRGLGQYWRGSAFYKPERNAMLRFVWGKSEFMRTKRENPDYSLTDIKEGNLTEHQTLKEFFLGLMAGTDDLTNVPIWVEAYHKRIKAGDNEAQAVKFADRLVSRVSGSGRKYDQAIITKGSDVERLFAKFYTFWNVEYANWARNLNQVQRDKIKNAPRFVGFVASRLVFIWASAMLVGGAPGDDEDKKKAWWWKQYLTYPLAFFPGIRDLLASPINEAIGLPSYGYRAAPIFNAPATAAKTATDLVKYAQGEKELDKLLESASKSAAYVGGYPDQFNTWFWNAYDIYFNDMDPKLQDAMLRRPKTDR